MNNLKRALVATVLTAGVSLETVGTAKAATLVVPTNLANTEGDSVANIASNTTSLGRFQQVFAGTEFSPNPQYITQIAFRPDGPTGNSFTGAFPNINISLSTTQSSPISLSSTFAQNLGIDNQVVFSGALNLSSSNTASGVGTKNFDVVINLQTPFLYNPTAGNLLYDSLFLQPSVVVGNDNVDATSSSAVVASVTSLFTGSPVNGTSLPGVGIVTQFTTTPVPEPSSTLGIVVLATVCAGAIVNRKLRKHN